MLHRFIITAIILAASAPTQTLKPLTDFADSYEHPALSPDGKTLLYDFSGGIFSRVTAGGPQIQFARSDHQDGYPANPRWSPDGHSIAFLRFYCSQCHHGLFVKGYPNGVERELGDVCGSPVVWTPDARFVIAAEPVGDDEELCRLVLIPVNGSRRIRLLKREGDVSALSPDGKRLA